MKTPAPRDGQGGYLTGSLVVGVLAMLPVFGALAQPTLEQLSSAQLSALERGVRIVLTESHAGAPWPAVTVFAYVQGSPQKAATVFADYERHIEYIPGVRRSHVSRVIDSVTVDVDYTLDVPIVRDEEYTVRDRISRDSSGAIRIDWTLVRASSTKAITGHLRFSRHINSLTGRAGTLIEYYNFVTPGSRLAGLGFIRSRATGQVQETVRAIVRRIEATP